MIKNNNIKITTKIILDDNLVIIFIYSTLIPKYR